ncbi:MAG: LUD domain-containing protein, partial [Pseudomonadota bacterium]
MQPQAHAFKDNARKALNDEQLRRNLLNVRHGFQDKRAKTVGKLPEFQALREAGKSIKDHVLENLDFYLERFEQKVLGSGGQVHWARNGAEAREAILDICRSVGAKTVTKGKSMIAEEIGLNDFLEEQGIEPIETDL